MSLFCRSFAYPSAIALSLLLHRSFAEEIPEDQEGRGRQDGGGFSLRGHRQPIPGTLTVRVSRTRERAMH